MKDESEKLIVDGQQVYFKSSEEMDEIEDESVQLIVTSPPYWNARNYGKTKQIGHGQTYKEYIKSLNRVWEECLRVLKPNGKIAINVQPLPIAAKDLKYDHRSILNIMTDIEIFMKKNGLYLSGMHYWNKYEYVSNVSWGSYPKPTNIASNTGFEQIFVWVKKGPTRKIPKDIMNESLLTKNEWRHWAVRCFWDDIAPVFKINSKGENKFGHSAPFPEEIPYRIIRMHTVKYETVLDPFLGSGTTLKICRLLNRKGIGYEINSEYRELIVKRIQEDWTPNIIENQYKVFGDKTMSMVLDTTIKETLNLIKNRTSVPLTVEEEKSIKRDLLKTLAKKFPRKFTTSFRRYILENDT